MLTNNLARRPSALLPTRSLIFEFKSCLFYYGFFILFYIDFIISYFMVRGAAPPAHLVS